jgi:hypothetical protein
MNATQKDTTAVQDTSLVVGGEYITLDRLLSELSPNTVGILRGCVLARMDQVSYNAMHATIPDYKEALLRELDHLAALDTALINA